MRKTAIGLIETRGMVAMIVGADAAVKAADVQLLGYQLIRQGLVSVMLAGDVDAVSAAIETGVAAAERVGCVVNHLVMPRPYSEVVQMLDTRRNRATTSPEKQEEALTGDPAGTQTEVRNADAPQGQTEATEPHPFENRNFEQYSVVELRRMVRALKQTELVGREISKANRETLLQLLRKYAESEGT